MPVYQCQVCGFRLVIDDGSFPDDWEITTHAHFPRVRRTCPDCQQKDR
jgi:hypothetical protein